MKSYSAAGIRSVGVWHEGVIGRKCEVFTSAVMLALEKDRDYKHVVYYTDINCSGQNKNYKLCTAILDKMTRETSEKTVTRKYLQTGHICGQLSCKNGVRDETKCKCLQF